MRIMNQAIENAVGHRWVTDLRVPGADRQLAGEQGGARLITFVAIGGSLQRSDVDGKIPLSAILRPTSINPSPCTCRRHPHPGRHYFEEALRLDPGYAPAWAGLGESHSTQAGSG